MSPPRTILDEAVARALSEDLGRAGDITSNAVIDADAMLEVEIAARQAGVIAGLALAERAFLSLDPAVTFDALVTEGAKVQAGTRLARIHGQARAILSAERTALNFLGRLSGIATLTRHMADAIAHTKARVCDTRKTTPGLRALEKWAVALGGGVNHRFGLDDAVLIKDNHVAAAGSVAAALTRARQAVGHMVVVAIEVDTLDQLREALAVGANAVLLDNMSNDQLIQAVAINAGRARLEASGNVTLATIAAIAETGVDMISSGALTHSAPNFDVGLDVIAPRLAL